MADIVVNGTFYLRINGVVYRTEGEYTIGVGGVNRTTVMSNTGVEGYTEEQIEPFISGNLLDSSQLSLKDVQGFSGSAQVQLKNGKTYTLSEAWAAELSELSPNSGTISGRLVGKFMDERVAG